MQLSARGIAAVSVVAASLVRTQSATAAADPALPVAPEREWRKHGGDAGHTQHSPLAAIHRGNVGRLRLAWTYHTGDARRSNTTRSWWTGCCTRANLFANSLVALRAATGERVWHYQLVRHDLWDRDLPQAPVLLDVRRGGRTIDAVAQATKSGHVFVFDRASGEPLFEIEERPVPGSDLVGEKAWKTQPLPRYPPAFSRQVFGEADATDISPASRSAVLERRLAPGVPTRTWVTTASSTPRAIPR